MEIVLLERVAKLGQMGEVVRVRDGYARNFLLPQGKALRATTANLKRFETERAQLEARNLERARRPRRSRARLDGQTFVVIRSASDGGALYGSVTTRDIADAATAGGFSLDRRQVVLDQPIKELGLHRLGGGAAPRGRGHDHRQRRPQPRGGRAAGLRPDHPGPAGRGRGRRRVRHPELFDDIGGAADERPAADPLTRARLARSAPRARASRGRFACARCGAGRWARSLRVGERARRPVQRADRPRARPAPPTGAPGTAPARATGRRSHVSRRRVGMVIASSPK